MRTTLLACAWLASITVGTQLLAQDCGTCCDIEPNCAGVSEISMMFDGCRQNACRPNCNQNGCNQNGCTGRTCNSQICGSAACNQTCGEDFCDQDICTQTGCDEETCDQGSCNNQGGCENQAGCNQDNCSSPYTYYQLRADWHKTHGPILDTVRCLHNSCPKKHHVKHNGNAAAQQRAAQTPWHGNYYYPQWGAPVALVVPPTAEFQSNYSWGVPATRISPIDAQFSRGFPGNAPGGGGVGGTGFLPPPQQPSDTNQIGVYYVRGPW